MKSHKSLILYFHTKATTFVMRDIQMLEEKYHVKKFEFYHKNKYYTPFLIIKQFFFILRNISNSKISFCMFAGYHSFFPAIFSKLLKKPFVIILGGTDSVVLPSINYGILRKRVIGTFARWSYRITPYFAPVHESLIFYENTYDNSLPKFQGLQHHVQISNAKFKVIHNGFDYNKFRILKGKRKPSSFITVAYDLHKPHLYQIKGADIIVKVASRLPHCSFTIVGLKELTECPTNVLLKPAVNHDELVDLYNNHQFYFQLSISEGFPNALCEAMLCGCIPIVSNISSMPEIIGNTGYVLYKRDEKMLEDLIRKILGEEDKAKKSLKAREQIVTNYPLSKRKEQLFSLIDSVSEKS